MIKITPVDPARYLWTIEDAFSAELLQEIRNTVWTDLSYRRLEIGFNRRRLIDTKEITFHLEITRLVQDKWMPYIEQQCGVKFQQNTDLYDTSWWLDEPGFQPAIHTDGDKPSAIQIYLLPWDRHDLGTTFFHDQEKKHVLHRFSSISNTGYLMFNTHLCQGERKLLWHDMERPVPESIMRLCFYVSLPSYELIKDSFPTHHGA